MNKAAKAVRLIAEDTEQGKLYTLTPAKGQPGQPSAVYILATPTHLLAALDRSRIENAWTALSTPASQMLNQEGVQKFTKGQEGLGQAGLVVNLAEYKRFLKAIPQEVGAVTFPEDVMEAWPDGWSVTSFICTGDKLKIASMANESLRKPCDQLGPMIRSFMQGISRGMGRTPPE